MELTGSIQVVDHAGHFNVVFIYESIGGGPTQSALSIWLVRTWAFDGTIKPTQKLLHPPRLIRTWKIPLSVRHRLQISPTTPVPYQIPQNTVTVILNLSRNLIRVRQTFPRLDQVIHLRSDSVEIVGEVEGIGGGIVHTFSLSFPTAQACRSVGPRDPHFHILAAATDFWVLPISHGGAVGPIAIHFRVE